MNTPKPTYEDLEEMIRKLKRELTKALAAIANNATKL